MKRKIFFCKTAGRKTLLSILLILSALFTACSGKKDKQISVAVFAPGILSDSPIYQMLADGVKEAADEYNGKKGASAVAVTILEAGTNQAEWSSKITSLAAAGNFDVIISSNPSLPDIVRPLTRQFPNQKFILLDAYEQGNPSVAAVRYNQREQSYITGYMAGLMSKTDKIGLLAAQEYPVMNNVILPGFKEGAESANKDISVDFRIVGNWYDASKGAELAAAMYNSGCDVILPICGGASQGVISAANEKGFYITWFDSNGFSKAPGRVISSTSMKQQRMAKEMTSEFLEGKTQWGTARTVGIEQGYIEFIQDDPLYISAVPEEIRNKMAKVIQSLNDGSLKLQ
ncbi:BMP family ABC transporter substrate-binding protein [Treponema parvum]|uniref:BMP family ABC transporter substrate-binding protein n=1 Tax=Treponema parvum TaxID=138851 RepID=UPI001AEBE2CE|nr:BMP family ABC transporter substrate-binding protein [Treponema parvum]QTQ15795.1 BMP family ABC transporter substrate-binding protein [Treponema parvum]